MHLQIVAAQFAIAVVAVYRCTVHDSWHGVLRPTLSSPTRHATRRTPAASVRTSTPAGPSPNLRRAENPSRPRPAAAGADQARHAAECKHLGNALKDVAARMRAGYSAKEGEQLRERKAKLEGQRRAKSVESGKPRFYRRLEPERIIGSAHTGATRRTRNELRGCAMYCLPNATRTACRCWPVAWPDAAFAIDRSGPGQQEAGPRSS